MIIVRDVLPIVLTRTGWLGMRFRRISESNDVIESMRILVAPFDQGWLCVGVQMQQRVQRQRGSCMAYSR